MLKFIYFALCVAFVVADIEPEPQQNVELRKCLYLFKGNSNFELFFFSCRSNVDCLNLRKSSFFL